MYTTIEELEKRLDDNRRLVVRILSEGPEPFYNYLSKKDKKSLEESVVNLSDTFNEYMKWRADASWVSGFQVFYKQDEKMCAYKVGVNTRYLTFLLLQTAVHIRGFHKDIDKVGNQWIYKNCFPFDSPDIYWVNLLFQEFENLKKEKQNSIAKVENENRVAEGEKIRLSLASIIHELS